MPLVPFFDGYAFTGGAENSIASRRKRVAGDQLALPDIVFKTDKVVVVGAIDHWPPDIKLRT